MTKLATEYTPVKVAPPEREMSHLEKEGGVEVDSGLPGQQPDGQVDEAPSAVGVCRGVQVGGGGKPVGQGESGDCQLLSKCWRLLILLN